jgi:hypothetical protein
MGNSFTPVQRARVWLTVIATVIATLSLTVPTAPAHSASAAASTASRAVAITGTKAVGKTLTAKPGKWAAGSRLSYRWLANGKAIKGATKRTYTVKPGNAGDRVAVKVTRRASGASRTSGAIRIANRLTPNGVKIAGTTTVGHTVTAVVRAWGPGRVQLRYTWKRNGTTITTTANPKYTLRAADAGARLSVTVTGTRAGYTTATRTSSAVNVNRATPAAPVPKSPAATTVTAPSTTAPNTTVPTSTPSPTPAPTKVPTVQQAAPAEAVPAETLPQPAEVESDPTWLSGASGFGVADGSFGEWRGTEAHIAGTWADNNQAMVEIWQLQKNGEYANWNKPIDVAIGAIGSGESWASAAEGAYDSRWRASLTKLKQLRSTKTGTVYIRFAHEMNGNWYPWSVNTTNSTSFVAAWKHFRALQQEIYPEAQLVFSVNRESVGAGMDWRSMFPGAQYVDVMSVDYYNQWPHVATAADWSNSVNAKDSFGAPKGLARHAEFAKSVGLPLAISEWGDTASNGGSPEFIRQMHTYMAANAGTGAGEILYDIYFNVKWSNNQFHLFGPDVKMPESATAYRDAF